MRPADVRRSDLDYWADGDPQTVEFAAPGDLPECEPCRAVVTRPDPRGPSIVRVPWKPDEIDLAHLAKGGTIWLSVWGGLPPHSLEVQEPS
jgi:hypothetical protein